MEAQKDYEKISCGERYCDHGPPGSDNAYKRFDTRGALTDIARRDYAFMITGVLLVRPDAPVPQLQSMQAYHSF